MYTLIEDFEDDARSVSGDAFAAGAADVVAPEDDDDDGDLITAEIDDSESESGSQVRSRCRPRYLHEQVIDQVGRRYDADQGIAGFDDRQRMKRPGIEDAGDVDKVGKYVDRDRLRIHQLADLDVLGGLARLVEWIKLEQVGGGKDSNQDACIDDRQVMYIVRLHQFPGGGDGVFGSDRDRIERHNSIDRNVVHGFILLAVCRNAKIRARNPRANQHLPKYLRFP